MQLAGRLMQVLNNLLSSTVKFTDAGAITLSVAPRPDLILFEVADTGTGMPRELWSAAFDQFRQLASFDTRNKAGTGLAGLAKRLVELMGGRIWLESGPSGTTFYFTRLLAGREITRNPL